MNRKQRNLVRLVAIILAGLLIFSAVISAVLNMAYAEEAAPAVGSKCELTMEYFEEEQALRISQRLVYLNESDFHLDRLIFYAPANLFRRQSALPYELSEIAAALPDGYLPGGMDLIAVRVDGEAADWGYQGADESYLRVACDLQSGESAIFEMDYYLLLTENEAFMGVSKGECRLSNFYYAPASLDASGEFILNMPIAFARYADVPKMDFSAAVTLPEGYLLSATGAEAVQTSEGGYSVWTASAEGAHDFAMAWRKDWRELRQTLDSGVEVRVLTASRGAGADALAAAIEAIEICEGWFGEFPFSQIDILQTNYGLSALSHTGCLWLNAGLLKSDSESLAHSLRRFIAQQYFGCSAWSAPSADAWLSDSISEFLAYLMLEEAQGHEAYLQALNENLVDSLQLTIPGGLRVNSDASLFSAYEYEIIVRNRGAIVFHELYTAMGREALIEGLKRFYDLGRRQDVITEINLVECLDAASGKSWEKFLTDWVFNVGDYVNQEIDWLE